LVDTPDTLGEKDSLAEEPRRDARYRSRRRFRDRPLLLLGVPIPATTTRSQRGTSGSNPAPSSGQANSLVRPVSTTPGAIETALTREFATARPRIFIEPGRYLVGDAGLLRTEVLLISQKSLHERDRWVFLQGPKMSVQRWRIESYGLGDFARPPRLVPQQLDDPA